ncbi:MAG: HEAT repeat domain-containing protein [Planctomycetota bacterium]|jgi:peptidyl-prolyl cis-trans isomerase A (cyclophilin A)
MRGLLLAFLLAAAALAETDLAPLLAGLESEQPLARYRAARALGALGARAREALPALLETLKDAEPWVRLEAGRALVRIGARERDVAALVRRLEHADPDLGPLLAEALAGMGEAAVPALRRALGSDDERTRRLALAAFHRAGRHAAAALPDLIDLMRDESPAVRKLAGEAMRRVAPWGAEYVPELVDRLRGQDEQIRWIAAQALGLLGPAAREAIPALKEMRREGSARLQEVAAAALRRIDIVPPRARHPALRRPALAKEQAPARFRARFETTRGAFVVEVHRAWAPHGADRFFNLVKIGYFDDTAFFRVRPGFVVQFGLHGDTRVSAVWNAADLPDDPVKGSNRKGSLCYAKSGPNSRTTQVFISLRNNAALDADGFAPFGRVVEGWPVVESLYGGYGDMPAFGGRGPDPRAILSLGNAYLKQEFPRLDYIERATLREK